MVPPQGPRFPVYTTPHPAPTTAEERLAHAIDVLTILAGVVADDLPASQSMNALTVELQDRLKKLQQTASTRRAAAATKRRRLTGRHKPTTSRRAVLAYLVRRGRP